MTALVTDYYPPGGVHRLMAGHLLHYNAVHSIIHCLLLIAIDYIFVHFVELLIMGVILLQTTSIPLQSSQDCELHF